MDENKNELEDVGYLWWRQEGEGTSMGMDVERS